MPRLPRMSDTSARVVIVGAGHAGGSVAALLRQYGWQGPVTLIGAEPVPPYQRPPLSKAWLKGEGDLAGLLLRPAAFYQANRIDLRLALRSHGHRPLRPCGDGGDRRSRPLRPSDPRDRLLCAVTSRARPRPCGHRLIAHARRCRSPPDLAAPGRAHRHHRRRLYRPGGRRVRAHPRRRRRGDRAGTARPCPGGIDPAVGFLPAPSCGRGRAHRAERRRWRHSKAPTAVSPRCA